MTLIGTRDPAMTGAGTNVVLVAALVSLRSLGEVEQARQQIAERTAPFTTTLASAAVDMKAMANDERGYLISGEADFREEIAERAATIREDLAHAGDVAPGGEERATVGRIAEKFDAWAEALEAEFDLYGVDRKAAIEVAMGDNRDLRKAYEEQLKAATEAAEKDLATALATVEARTAATRSVLLAALLVLAGLAVAGGVWLELRTRRRLAPLVARLRSLDEHCVNDLDRGLRAIAQGDLTFDAVPMTEPIADHARDQIGAAVTTTNALIAKVHGSVESYGAMRGQLGELIGDIAGSSRTLSTASQQMASTSDEAGRAVGEIAGAVTDVAQGAERQMRMVESTRAAVQNASQVAKVSGDTARATDVAAENARRAAREGVDAAEHASTVIEQVAASSEQGQCGDPRARRQVRAGRRDRRHDHRDLRADQPAGPQRGDRGRARRRAGPRLRRGGRGGPQAGRGVAAGRRADRRPDRRDPDRDGPRRRGRRRRRPAHRRERRHHPAHARRVRAHRRRDRGHERSRR
jgi:CHASE3 domain sensor protein